MADLQRTQKERMASLGRLSTAWRGPVHRIAAVLVVPATEAPKDAIGGLLEGLDPEFTRQSGIPLENIVVVLKNTRGCDTERVGHLKISFDLRNLAPAAPQTGDCDLVSGIRRIEVKGRKRGQTIRLTTNEWNKVQRSIGQFRPGTANDLEPGQTP